MVPKSTPPSCSFKARVTRSPQLPTAVNEKSLPAVPPPAGIDPKLVGPLGAITFALDCRVPTRFEVAAVPLLMTLRFMETRSPGSTAPLKAGQLSCESVWPLDDSTGITGQTPTHAPETDNVYGLLLAAPTGTSSTTTVNV